MVSQVQAEIQAIAAENDALKTSLEEQNTYAQVDVCLLCVRIVLEGCEIGAGMEWTFK